MGWLTMPLSSMYPHTGPKAYLDAQFTYDHVYSAAGEHLAIAADKPLPEGAVRRGLRVIASSCLRNKVWYAAITPFENGVDGPTFAAICLVQWNPRSRDGEHFGYKDMDETAGPYETECPERILRLLDPTENHCALLWRRRCIKNLMRVSRPLEDGMHIRLASAVRFTDGYEGNEFFIRKQGRKTALALTESGPALYRLSGLKRRDFTIIPQTRIHKTIIA